MIRQSSHFTSRIYNRRFGGQVFAIVDSYVAKPEFTLPSIPSLPSLPKIPSIQAEESKGRRGSKTFAEGFRGTSYDFQVPTLPKPENKDIPRPTNWYKKGWDVFMMGRIAVANQPDVVLPGFNFRPLFLI